LQIYLDSSDFSTFANLRRQEVHKDIEQRLVGWANAGLIEIRFSYLHVIEASPVRPEDVASSSARLKKIRELCGQKCLRSTISILEREVAEPGACASCQDYMDWLLRDDGDWLPDTDGLAEDVSPSAIIKDEIHASFPDRARRRVAERQLFDKNGKLRPLARAKLMQRQPATVAELEERFPLPPGAAELLARALLVEGDQQKFRALLRVALSDLSYWPSWYEKHWDRVAPVSGFLRETARKVNEGLGSICAEVERTYADGLAQGMESSYLDRMLNQIFADSVSSMYSNIVDKIGSQTVGGSPTVVGTPWELRPGLATALSVQQQIARKIVGLAGRARKADDGDFGDVMHCVHLPFVDFFRADAFAASAISAAKLPYKTAVVPKLVQLPTLIESELIKRGLVFGAGSE